MVNLTLKTSSTRGLAHFSSSSFTSGTVNSSTVAAEADTEPEAKAVVVAAAAAAAAVVVVMEVVLVVLVVAASGGCLPADAGSLAPGCSDNVSSVTRLIPSRGRVVDIPLLSLSTAPADLDSVLEASGDVRSLWCFHGVLRKVLRSGHGVVLCV